MAEKNETKGFLTEVTNFKNIVLTLLAIATAITTYLNLVRSNDLQAQLNSAEIDFKQLEADISQKRFSNEQFLLLNREVRESLSQDNSCDQRLLLAMLIDKMLADEIAIRDSIRNIITKSQPDNCSSATDYIVREQQSEQVFEILQAELASFAPQANDSNKSMGTPSQKTLRVDVFYLEDIRNEAEPRANQVKELIETTYPGYQVRVRLLPKSVNARSGYRIGDNQIRFDSDEKEIAKALQELINNSPIFSLEQPSLVQIRNKTRDYVSIFVRNM